MDMLFALVCLVIAGLVIASMWVIFSKAGQPGWAAIIPIYNLYILLKIADRPGWWLILYIIPVVSLIISILVVVDIAKAFGKGVGFAVGMIFLPIIFYPILAFGDATYVGKSEALPPAL